jgi:hypothetical protein
MSGGDPIISLPGVCDVKLVPRDGKTPRCPPDLLIEVPHGATKKRHFEAVRHRLVSPLPKDLRDFFFVNTDVGSFECATFVARMIASAAEGEGTVLILRCLVPRTFIDCNRVAGPEGRGAMPEITPAVPEYITDDKDRTLLEELHRSYQNVARRAYEWVCGAGGRALQLHTYAPRAIRIEHIDGDIVKALHRAYDPGIYQSWKQRPDVDLISEARDGTPLASPSLVASIKSQYAGIGIEVEENASYRLHPSTMGYRHATAYPGRALCIEISRALLADPFSPFEEMRIGPEKVERMSGPIGAAYLAEMFRPGESQRPGA